LKSEERIQTLTRLALTKNQARVYLALLQAGPATAKELGNTSKIARPDIYRIIPALLKEGIVEKLITSPASFQALPVNHALPILLKRKTTEQSELRKKTQELLRDLENNHFKKEPQEADPEFIAVPGIKAIMQRLKEKLLKTQINLCVVTSQTRFSAAILEFANGYQKALERGVKIRIAAEKHVAQRTAFKIVQTLSKDPKFEVKYFADPPPAIVTIFDDKEACVTMSAMANLEGASAIWSNNLGFVALAQDYFENRWNNSTHA
jgi:sugar-specific transcriptional regulator TrmB